MSARLIPTLHRPGRCISRSISHQDVRSSILLRRATHRSIDYRTCASLFVTSTLTSLYLDLRTMSESMSIDLSGVQLGQRSLRVNALIAVLLAISGVYSVVAFAVARRQREIAIRVALGGSRSSIVAMLLRQALRPALLGIVVGLVFSAIISRAIALVLFGVNPLDPLTYALTTLALGVAAATASCVPALRATRANSVVALRAE